MWKQTKRKHTNRQRKSEKQNKYQNKSKAQNHESKRSNNCITEKYLQNDNHRKKKKDSTR